VQQIWQIDCSTQSVCCMCNMQHTQTAC